MLMRRLLRSPRVAFAIRSINSNTFCNGKINTHVSKLCVNNLSTKDDANRPNYLKDCKDGKFDKIPDSTSKLGQFKDKLKDTTSAAEVDQNDDVKPPPGTYALPHPVWTQEQVHNVEITNRQPEGRVDKMAYYSVMATRKCFDIFSGFIFGQRNEKKWLTRICFLETVAGVPGMVAAMARHMKSLRRMQRDYGWIHTLLEEAENERMHLLTAMELKKPSMLFRLAVLGSQGVFVTMFTGAYILSPKFCHRFVGYLEEEAVKTYSKCLEDIEDGPMEHWKIQPATDLAIRYWKLPKDATMKDVILAIRADEAHHRIVNHTLASMKQDDFNPYKPGE